MAEVSDASVLVRATPADLDLLVELNAEYCAADGHTVDAHRARAGFAPLLTDDRHGAVWLIGDTSPAAGHTTTPATTGTGTGTAGTLPARTVAGYVVAAWSWSVEVGGAEAVLDEIYVRTRNRGLGGAALEAVVGHCRARGMRRIVLETERTNEDARRLYLRRGFVADDSIWMMRALER